MIVHRSSRSSLSVVAPAARGGGGGVIVPTLWPGPSQLYIIVDGDSISAGAESGIQYSQLAATTLASLPTWSSSIPNVASSGETLDVMRGNYATSGHPGPLIAPAVALGNRVVQSCFGGTNDIVANGATAAQAYTIFQNYWALPIPAGCTFQICWTLLPRGQFAGFETIRQTFNTSVRGGFAGLGIDRLVDIGNDPNLGNVNATSNSSLFFQDLQTHPTAAGDQIMANAFLAAVMSIGSSSTVTGISPATGAIAGGTSFTITGTKFANVISVSIGGISAASFTVVNSTTITGTTGAGYFAGVGDVVVCGSFGAGILAGGWTWT